MHLVKRALQHHSQLVRLLVYREPALLTVVAAVLVVVVKAALLSVLAAVLVVVEMALLPVLAAVLVMVEAVLLAVLAVGRQRPPCKPGTDSDFCSNLVVWQRDKGRHNPSSVSRHISGTQTANANAFRLDDIPNSHHAVQLVQLVECALQHHPQPVPDFLPHRAQLVPQLAPLVERVENHRVQQVVLQLVQHVLHLVLLPERALQYRPHLLQGGVADHVLLADHVLFHHAAPPPLAPPPGLSASQFPYSDLLDHQDLRCASVALPAFAAFRSACSAAPSAIIFLTAGTSINEFEPPSHAEVTMSRWGWCGGVEGGVGGGGGGAWLGSHWVVRV